MRTLIIIFCTLLFSCTDIKSTDCTLIDNVKIAQKRQDPIVGRCMSDCTIYSLILIDDNGTIYRVRCNRSQYQMAIVGADIQIANCITKIYE